MKTKSFRRFEKHEIDQNSLDFKLWHKFIRRREFEMLSERFCEMGKFERALELGAGDGGQSEIIAKHCKRLVCTEIYSSSPLAIGPFQPRDARNVEYRLCDARDLGQFADREFDLVFSSNMLEHVDGWKLCLDECNRVLKDSGLMLHIMPNRVWKFWNSWVSLVHKRTIPTLHGVDSSHFREWNSFSVKGWTRRIESAGFEITETMGLPFYFGHGPRPLWLIRMGNRAGWSASTAYFCRKKGSTGQT